MHSRGPSWYYMVPWWARILHFLSMSAAMILPAYFNVQLYNFYPSRYTFPCFLLGSPLLVNGLFLFVFSKTFAEKEFSQLPKHLQHKISLSSAKTKIAPYQNKLSGNLATLILIVLMIITVLLLIVGFYKVIIV